MCAEACNRVKEWCLHQVYRISPQINIGIPTSEASPTANRTKA